MRRFLLVTLFGWAMLQPAHAANWQTTSELQDFVGQYTLADGRTLSITQRRHHLVAQVDGQAATELTADGPATYVSPSRHLRLAFDQRVNGNVAGVILIGSSTSPK